MDPSRGYELVNEMRLLHRTLAAHGQHDLIARLTTIGTHTKAWAEHLWQSQAPFALATLATEVHGIEQELQTRGLRGARSDAQMLQTGMAEWAREVGLEHAALRESLVHRRDELVEMARENAEEIARLDHAAADGGDSLAGRLQGLITRADSLATGDVEDFGQALLAITRDVDHLAVDLTGQSVELPWRLQAIGGGYGAALEEAGLAIGADDAFSFR